MRDGGNRWVDVLAAREWRRGAEGLGGGQAYLIGRGIKLEGGAQDDLQLEEEDDTTVLIQVCFCGYGYPNLLKTRVQIMKMRCFNPRVGHE